MRTVLLKHTLPDTSWHIDWLIEVDGSRAEHLPTFRLAGRPDLPTTDGFDAERIDDHRRLYLDYTGPVSGGRGRVDLVSEGDVLDVVGWPDFLDVTVQLGERVRRWEGQPVAGTRWRFERTSPPD